ncbi:hypothetical protein BH10PSE5_BH10PSE5_24020 [soil metagenome]
MIRRQTIPLPLRQAGWFLGLWLAGVLGLGLVAGGLKMIFNLILR